MKPQKNSLCRKSNTVSGKKIFMEKTFTDCSLVPPKDHAPKLLRIPTKPQNLQKFSPSRVSCYTVQQLDDMLRRVKGELPSKGSSSSRSMLCILKSWPSTFMVFLQVS